MEIDGITYVVRLQTGPGKDCDKALNKSHPLLVSRVEGDGIVRLGETNEIERGSRQGDLPSSQMALD